MALAVITGATGLLGGNLAVELLKQGHAVRATRRQGSRAEHLAAYAIEWVEAELGDEVALARAFAGAEVVFHCAAQVGVEVRVSARMVEANVEGTRHVIAAVRAAGVKRLVHCSTVGAVGLSEDGQPCTEEARWNFAERGMADAYTTTKHQAEALVHGAVKEGLDAVVVNPTFMLGPLDARLSSGKLVYRTVMGQVPGTSPGRNNFVDVRDVARGMVLAWQKGKTGERYILGGENLTYAEILRRIARVAGVRPPRFAAPRLLALPLALLGHLQEVVLHQEPLMTLVAWRYAYCPDHVFSSEKAKRELGYTQSPLEPAIADCIAWFRARGVLPPPAFQPPSAAADATVPPSWRRP